MANSKKKQVGRPTKMTDEVVGKLREGFLMGFTNEQASAYAEISRDTLQEYISKNPEFSYQIKP